MPPVTTTPPEPPQTPADPTGLLREVAGLLLLVLGLIGLGVAAFAWDWRAGLGLVSAVLATAGWRLSTTGDG